MSLKHETPGVPPTTDRHRRAHPPLVHHRATESVTADGQAPSLLHPAPSLLQRLQRTAGNAAVAEQLALQRHYDMREHQGHTPSAPYTEIHFRFDTDTLPDTRTSSCT